MESEKKWVLAIIFLIIGLIAGSIAGFYSGSVSGTRTDTVRGYEQGRLAGLQEAAVIAEQREVEKAAAAAINPFTATITDVFSGATNPFEGVTINPFAQ